MRSLKQFATPLAIAAVLGLGFGVGVSHRANAADQACRRACAAEFQSCLAEGSYPGFFRCRAEYSQCVQGCG